MKTYIVKNDHCLHHLYEVTTNAVLYEVPARYEVIHNALIDHQLLTTETQIESRLATQSEITLCHTSNYYLKIENQVKTIEQRHCREIPTGDTLVSAGSLIAARAAVGSVLTAVNAIKSPLKQRFFCMTRPPGHHAEKEKGMGFCLFNNIAIGAHHALTSDNNINKILIVDWDIHHGNGTQQIFYDNPNVFYFSTHLANFYPFTGFEHETGEGEAEGTNLNCPIHPPQYREKMFDAIRLKLIPTMETFKPDLVMISAGFDIHRDDPIGGVERMGGEANCTGKDFELLTQLVTSIANRHAKGRVISVLEGGYSLDVLADSVPRHVYALSI